MVAKRSGVEEELKAELENAQAVYQRSMASANGSRHEEASARLRHALERFHRFILNGVIPDDLQDPAR